MLKVKFVSLHICFTNCHIHLKKLFVTFSNSDSANVIATAGHGGLKFWDLR